MTGAYHHSVTLDREKCTGCTNCLKRCPTEAIRIRDNHASIIDGRCIDCGECIRTCIHHAKIAVTDPLDAIHAFKYKVALPAPTLYGQFKGIENIDRLLSALLSIGFDDVVEVARGAEYVSAATHEMLKKPNLPRPLISSACPAIVRLIRVRFPELLPNIVDLVTPMDAAAVVARKRAVKNFGCKPEEVGVFFITPCPAKMTAIRAPLGIAESPVDGAISILEIYGSIAAQLRKPFDEKKLRDAGMYGVGWASPGGEALAAGIDNAMSVDGIQNVLMVLEQIENNKLNDLEYFEGLACVAGCHGGPLVFENNYVSRNRLRKLKIALGGERPVLPLSGEITPEEMHVIDEISPHDVFRLGDSIVESLRMSEQIAKITKNLPGLDCGNCGSPSCETLAEDVVRGEATEMSCIYKLRDRVGDLARQMVNLYDDAKK